MELLASVIDEAVAEAVKSVGIDADIPVSLSHTQEESRLVQFVFDRFNQGFFQRDIKVFSGKDTVESGMILSISVNKAGVRYDEVFREKFWGKRWFLRTAEVDFSIRAMNGERGSLEWIGQINKHRQDRIPYSALPMIEQGDLLLGKLDRPRERGIRSWVEPVFVIATAGTVAYLFYTIRSQ